jgi:L-ascorbate metabolism protein UlaG (beta-lactamase superfamily)
MTNLLAAAVATALVTASPAATPTPGNALEITWYGQSCFLMRTPARTTVLMDPVAYGIGYNPPTIKADVVTISHEHPDHNNVKMVEVVGSAAGGAEVIRGLTREGWSEVDESVGDVHITSLHTFHDDQQGKKYGRNTIFVFDVAGRRLVHLGDLGAALTPEQITALGQVDVLMIPVGGTYTIDASAANKVIAAIKPRYVVFPMHYKTAQLKIRELAAATEFLAGKTSVLHLDGNSFTVADTAGAPPPTEPVVITLKAD